MFGARLTLRVQPRARRNEIVGWQDDVLRVRVTAPPVEGDANTAVIALLADRLRVPRFAITLLHGHASRIKVVQVEDLTLEEVRQQLEAHS